jgi:hypothetical protein
LEGELNALGLVMDRAGVGKGAASAVDETSSKDKDRSARIMGPPVPPMLPLIPRECNDNNVYISAAYQNCELLELR